MARSLPMYVDASILEVTLPASEESTATQITDANGRGCAGVLLRGVACAIGSTGGKVTVNVYSEATVADAIQYYSVEFDFTSVEQTSDTQDPGIPILVDPYITITGDATSATEDCSCLVYLQKIAIGS